MWYTLEYKYVTVCGIFYFYNYAELTRRVMTQDNCELFTATLNMHKGI